MMARFRICRNIVKKAYFLFITLSPAVRLPLYGDGVIDAKGWLGFMENHTFRLAFCCSLLRELCIFKAKP